MLSKNTLYTPVTKRAFLRLMAVTAGSTLLAGCRAGATPTASTVTSIVTPPAAAALSPVAAHSPTEAAEQASGGLQVMAAEQRSPVAPAAATAESHAAPAASAPSQHGGHSAKASLTPEQAIRRLREGNQRYTNAEPIYPDQTDDHRILAAKGQQPFAAVFGCIDSRVPPELVFDQGLGKLLVIRTAGHVLDDAVIGSIEFGVHEFGIPLVVVLGHERCGAVAATIEAIEQASSAQGEISTLIQGVMPAIEIARAKSGDLLNMAVKTHTELVVDQLRMTPILFEAIEQERLQIVGAHYNLGTGEVDMIKL
jgi:carbonic anhydrase